MKTKALIFDMDNTLIRSAIDFALMKREVAGLFQGAGLAADLSLPVVKIIESLRPLAAFTEELEDKIWSLILEIELKGMENALPEEGVKTALELLKAQAYLLVVTNNHYQAAEKALAHAGLRPYFDRVLGRGNAPALKPSPAGFLQLLQELPQVKDCLVIGDAYIDLEAAAGAGLGFIAYNGSRAEDWRKAVPRPLAQIGKWDQEAAELILKFL